MAETVVESWEHRQMITNGIRMHYVIQGEGPLVVLMHGFPAFWYSWRHQIPFLAAHGFRVVAPDLRGYNETEKPHSGYDIPNLLRDIVGLIYGLNEERAIIVGHDWGGALAWQFAIDYPEMTSSLIILNAPHPGAMLRELRTLQQLRKSWYILAFQIPWLPEYLLGFNHADLVGRLLRESAVQKRAFSRSEITKYRRAMSKPGTLTASLNYYRQLLRSMLRFSGKHNLQVPASTLLIWGEQDVALGIDLTRNLDPWVPDLTLKYISESGHWVHQECPELVNEYMLEFLQTHPL